MLQIEFEFTLPCGYIDEQGNLHRQGVMRRASALDEIEPLADPRVRSNEAYLSILLLSRVITRIGALTQISPAMIARLFATAGAKATSAAEPHPRTQVEEAIRRSEANERRAPNRRTDQESTQPARSASMSQPSRGWP